MLNLQIFHLVKFRKLVNAPPSWILPTQPPAPPPAREGQATGLYQDQMLIYGGQQTGNSYNDLWSYSITNGKNNCFRQYNIIYFFQLKTIIQHL